jgi:hypothetical protein
VAHGGTGADIVRSGQRASTEKSGVIAMSALAIGM